MKYLNCIMGIIKWFVLQTVLIFLLPSIWGGCLCIEFFAFVLLYTTLYSIFAEFVPRKHRVNWGLLPYSLYAIVDSWDNVNADGIIQLESTSMGAVSYGVDVELPEGYVTENPRCTNPDHNHIDPHNIVDARAGLLPDHTFYFYNQNHEKTGNNDVVMLLAVELLTDENFKDKLMETLSQLGNSIDGFAVKEPTLNEIFVSYTEGQI